MMVACPNSRDQNDLDDGEKRDRALNESDDGHKKGSVWDL